MQNTGEFVEKPAGQILKGRDLEPLDVVQIFMIDLAFDVGDDALDIVKIVRPAVNRVGLALQIDADQKGMAVQAGKRRGLVGSFECKLLKCFHGAKADCRPPPLCLAEKVSRKLLGNTLI